MRILSVTLGSLFLLSALGHADEPKGPELKKIEITKEIRARLDEVEKRIDDDFPISFLPEATNTLEEAYKILKGKKQKQEREALDRVLTDADPVYTVEFTVGQGDSNRTVFVFSRSVDFKQMLYAYSPVKKGEQWRVNVIGK